MPNQVGRGGEVDWDVVVDATIVRAHQHAAGAPKGGSNSDLGSAAEAEQALGPSRGGLTTKLHLACDGRGRPLGMLITAGQRHDSTQLEPGVAPVRWAGQS